VVEAASGEQAIDKLRRGGSYRAVLLDVTPGKGDGLRVLHYLKREKPELLRRTILLADISEWALRNLTESDLVWGAARKPLDFGFLLDLVRACRAQMPRRATPAPSAAGTMPRKARGGSR
jgi:DNA-binding NarL/FixJ family response regulator